MARFVSVFLRRTCSFIVCRRVDSSRCLVPVLDIRQFLPCYPEAPEGVGVRAKQNRWNSRRCDQGRWTARRA